MTETPLQAAVDSSELEERRQAERDIWEYVTPKTGEPPNTVHGRLLEAVHISGYTFERACAELDWLLTNDRWKQVGSGYDDINKFVATIDLSEFKIAVGQRQNLARKLAALEASQRATAKALGVAASTINTDLKPVQDRTEDAEEASIHAVVEDADVQDRTPAWFQADVDPAKLAKTGEKQAKRAERDQAIAQRRAEAEAKAKETIEASDFPYSIEVADLHTWRPSGVDAIITDPPYITEDAVELHAALGDFALDVLPDGGALVILTWQPLLPAVMRALDKPGLVYRWTAAWVYETSARTPERKPRVFDGWKPILVYHKNHIPDEATYLYDVVKSPDADKTHHEWGQAPEGFMQLVRAFTEPGQTVCDPFLGGGTTAVAALAESRFFIGCDIDPGAIKTTFERLVAE